LIRLRQPKEIDSQGLEQRLRKPKEREREGGFVSQVAVTGHGNKI